MKKTSFKNQEFPGLLPRIIRGLILHSVFRKLNLSPIRRAAILVYSTSSV